MNGLETQSPGTLNPIRRFEVYATWNARRDGGLYAGLHIRFPTCILYDNGEVRNTVNVSIGLLVTTVRIIIRGPIIRLDV